MDPTLFTPASPGQVVPSAGDFAFIPDPLPPQWEFASGLWPLVVEAQRQLATLEGVGRYLPNPAILLRPLIDREAIQSSRIEGTYATAREYLLFEISPREPTSDTDPANDWREVHNYRRALELATTTSLPLSLRLIREMHRELMAGVRGRDRVPGEFRRVAVAIGTKAETRFVPPPASALGECLDRFEKYLHQEPRSYDPLVECFLIHYQFEAIHPFLDGNGRVGRLLLIFMIQRLCGLSKPWLHMSQFFAQHREQYIQHLFAVSTHGAWEAWIRFCLEGTVAQCKDTIDRCDRLRRVKEKFAIQVQSIKGSTRLGQIVDMVFDSPFIAVTSLAEKLDVYYQTALADLMRLQDAGLLRELSGLRPRTFNAPEIFALTYQDLGGAEE